MKISELIEKMRSVIADHGDMDVMCWPYDGQGRYFQLEPIEVANTEGRLIVVLDA